MCFEGQLERLEFGLRDGIAFAFILIPDVRPDPRPRPNNLEVFEFRTVIEKRYDCLSGRYKTIWIIQDQLAQIWGQWPADVAQWVYLESSILEMVVA